MMHSHNAKISPEKVRKIVKDSTVRRSIIKECHLWFFNIYFPHYVKYETAPFHRELFAVTEDEKIRNIVIEAFRGSAKTTIMSSSYSIWAILGRQQRKFVLILAQTQEQARQYLAAIKAELEANRLLRADLGPFEEPDDEWRSTSIVLPKYGARIMVASIDKPVRGLRHGAYRPDLIICDDLEDLGTVKTLEGREKIYNWLMGDVIPLGDKNTRLIVVGTKLHEDSILMRLKRAIGEGHMDGVVRSYPLVDERGVVAWPGKYRSEEDIDMLHKSVPSVAAWEREYMLRIISSDEQVIRPEWIKYYDPLPGIQDRSDCRFSAIGVDPAIGESETSDFTAMVFAKIYGHGNGMRIYILPNPINEKMDFPKTVARIKQLSETLGEGMPAKIYIEGVAYQKALIDQLKSEGYAAEEFMPRGEDKRARLALTSNLIQTGKVLFPQKGAELLISQLTGFGAERHDDLADAFCALILKIASGYASRKQFFSKWSASRHIVVPRPIPDPWKLFRAYHHGRETPACCKWYALDYEGRVWVYREFYCVGLSIDQIAAEINKLSGSEGYIFSVADPSIFATSGFVDRHGGQTIAETFARRGVMFQSASDRRIDGWNLMHQYLNCDEYSQPKLVYFNTCRDSIRTIPELFCDEKNPEDIDKEGEMSAANCDRYFLTSLHESQTQPPLNEVQRKLQRMREEQNPKPWENRYWCRH